MSTLSSAPNVRTTAYKKLFRRLPAHIQGLADDAFKLFLKDPLHPLLDNHELHNSKKGRHRNESRAVAITLKYRAIYVVDGQTNVWYWCGSHEDYNNFVGK